MKNSLIQTGVTSAGLFCGLCLAAASQAYFQDAAEGVRPSGMGSAFVAVADDANTMLYNPAGLARVYAYQLTGMYSDLYTHLNAGVYTGQSDRLGYTYAAASLPLSRELGCLGASWTQFNSLFYKENQATISYGRFLLTEPSLDLGINLKLLNFSVAANDYSADPQVFPFSSHERTAVTADLGLLASPWEGFNVGLGVENLIPANMGFSTVQTVPRNLRAGAAYWLPLELGQLDSCQISAEWSGRDGWQNYKFGTEVWMLQSHVAARAGLNLDEWTAGFSVRFNRPGTPLNVQLDYAFASSMTIAQNYGSHRMGLTLTWDMLTAAGESVRQPTESSSINLYFQEAMKAMKDGKYEEATAWLEEILASDPQHQEAQKYLEQARQLLAKTRKVRSGMAKQRASAAIIRKESKLALDPATIHVAGIKSLESEELPAAPVAETISKHWQAAMALHEKNEQVLAITELETILALSPDNAEAKRKAEQWQAELLQNVNILYQAGVKDFDNRQYSQAQQKFQGILKYRPDYTPAQYYYFVLQRWFAGKLDEKYDAAVHCWKLRQFAKALEYFRQVQDMVPEYKDTWHYLGMAGDEIKKAARIRIQYKLAKQHLAEGELDQALELLAPITETRADIPEVFRLYQEIQRTKQEAGTCYQQGIKYFKGGQYALAVAQLRRSMELDKQNDADDLLMQVYCDQGILAYRDDRLEEAVRAWSEALKLAPENPVIQKYLLRGNNKLKFYKQHKIK